LKKVTCHLFHEPVEISKALIAIASQEGNDGPEYDLMMAAAERIRELEAHTDFLYEDVNKREYAINSLKEELKLALPAMRLFADNNPKFEYYGKVQDSCGVHAWLARNDHD
jgi:hypothetical protein